MSPNSLFSLTPPQQKPFQTNGNIHGGISNQKTPRPSLTPPAPPNSEKLTMAIKLVESTLDEAIEDVRRVICIQEEEEAVRMEKQLLLLEEEVVAKEDGVRNRKYEAVVSSQRKAVEAAKLFTLEEDGDIEDDQKSEEVEEEEVEVEIEATDDIVSSLQSLDISRNSNEEEEEEEDEEIVISRPSAAAASRRQILDDSSDSSSSSSLDSEQDYGNNDDDDEQDFVMIDEEAIVFEKEDDESAASTSNNDDGIEQETTKDDILDGGFADLKITDDDGDDVSDVSFGQNNQFDDDSFTEEREEIEEESNDEDSLATANILQTPKDDNDDDSILLSFEGCGCWSLDNETGDLYLSSTTDNGNSDPKKTNAKWPKIKLPLPLYNKLYQHQRIGVQWMASLHHDEIKGGLLADDMGLGKTMQVLTYLGSLMRAETICNAIIICPKSVVRSWEREANLNLKNICVPKATVTAVTSDMGKAKRKRVFEDAFCAPSKRPQLVITTYGLVSNHITDLTNISNTYEESRWCYVVLDEGHQIKNSSTKMSRDVRILASRSPHTRRLLMTGTPMQNNMKELHSLFDWACGGKLLGSLKTFLNKYGLPIEEGRQKNASEWTVKKASEMNEKLQNVLKPYFLQRLKKTEFQDKLPGKKELVVFTHLSAKQRLLYEAYLEGDIVSSVLTGETASPLAAVSWLKMLCGHPSLVKEAADEYKDCDVDVLVQDSSKLQVLISLVSRLKKSGHKALIFSQSTKMLNIIELALADCVRHLRIDGSTANNYRQKAVDHFNDKDSNVDVMLLSTKAAGVGLTLTGADRAIIYDPSWNPAEDAQAVDRCYRIGQEKPVTVYRFISAGTVEEKIYEKQVHKDGIRRVILGTGGGSSSTERYFQKDDLRKLFKLGPRGESTMLDKFNAKSENDAKGASGKKSYLTKHASVVGVASHDVLYSTDALDTDPFSRKPYQLKKKDKQNVLSKDDSMVEDLTVPYSPRFDAVPLGRGRSIKAKIKKAEEPKESSKSEECTIAATLDEADALIANGNLDRAMSLLLDIVEDESIVLAQDQKLATHGKIAQIGCTLGWL
eukprot:scaffold17962_cov112-Skeletonema_dohrnii-CCMP3373.AAC.1